ncbi:MAG: 3-phosphoglycerate dehydrogenase, partial [Nitrosopumilus sp.]|nr:3-phosphoglycerate dehydrogenase [Nitrosopumilus sp.]
LDVFEKEPAIGTKLAELDNVILTPHIGAQTKEAQSLAANVIAEKIIQILRGVI